MALLHFMKDKHTCWENTLNRLLLYRTNPQLLLVHTQEVEFPWTNTEQYPKSLLTVSGVCSHGFQGHPTNGIEEQWFVLTKCFGIDSIVEIDSKK